MDDLIEKKESNVIETTACAINILNISREMRHKGMQRKYWEGGMIGEGFIPLVKCNLKRGTKLKGSITNAVRKIYHKKTLDILKDHHDSLTTEEVIDGLVIEGKTEQTVDEESSDKIFFNKDRY